MEYTIHTVKHDDSFERLANRYNCKADEIIRTHNQTAPTATSIPLTIESTIHPGDKIRIPVKHKTSSNQAYVRYYVEESITSINTIARYYETTAVSIRAINKQPIPNLFEDSPVNVPIKTYTYKEQTESNTNDNNEKTSSLGICTPNACTEDELIIEVIGKPTDDKQRILIYSLEDQYDPKTTKRELETLDDSTLSSVLHKWPWQAAETKHLYLEIATTAGEAIKLPLLTGDIKLTTSDGKVQTLPKPYAKARLTTREKSIHGQQNLIAPFVPMTELFGQGFSLTQPNQKITIPVLSRSGWVYIFQDNQLWREVAIRQNDITGKTTYHDVRLSDYRTKDANKILIDENKDIRKPVGKALENIWLPARWNNQTQNWQIFYAESQLSEARINELQRNQKLLKTRSHHINMALSLTPTIAYPSTVFKGENHPFLLKNKDHTVPDHLPRDPVREHILLNPLQYLIDSSQLKNEQEQAKKLHDYYSEVKTDTISEGFPDMDGVSQISYVNPYPVYAQQPVKNVSPSGWTYWLKQKLAQDYKAELTATEEGKKSPHSPWTKYLKGKDDQNKLWQSPNWSKALTKPIQQNICGILLADPLNLLNHLHSLILSARELQMLLMDEAMTRKHYGSAYLVNNIMLDSGNYEDENGKKRTDDRYKAANRLIINEKPKSRLYYALAHKEREEVANMIESYQKPLSELLTLPITVEAIKDTTATIGFDLRGGMTKLAELLKALAHPNTSDPLVLNSEKQKIGKYENIVQTLVLSSNPYHGVIMPPYINLVSMKTPYTPKTTQIRADGLGLWNPSAMSMLETLTDSNLSSLLNSYPDIDKPTEKIADSQIEKLQANGLNTVQGHYMAKRAELGLDQTVAVTLKAAALLVGYLDSIDSLVKKTLANIENSATAKSELFAESAADLDKQIQEIEKQQHHNNIRQKALEQYVDKNQQILDRMDQDLSEQKINQQKAEAELRAKLLESNKAYAALEKSLAEIDTGTYLNHFTDSEILSWKSFASEQHRNLQTITKETQQLLDKQCQLADKIVANAQEVENIKQQQAGLDTKINESRTERTKIANAAKDEMLNSSKFKQQQMQAIFSAEVMRQTAYSSFFEPELITEITADSEKIPLGIDRNIVDQLGHGQGTNKWIFTEAKATVFEFDQNGKKVSPVGWENTTNQNFLKQNSNPNIKIKITGIFIAGNRKNKNWTNYKKATDQLDKDIALAKQKYNQFDVSKQSFIEQIDKDQQALEESYNQQAEKQRQNLQTIDDIAMQDLEQKQQHIDASQQQVDTSQAKVDTLNESIKDLEQQQNKTAEQQAQLKAESAKLEAEQQKLQADKEALATAQADKQERFETYQKESATAKADLATYESTGFQHNNMLKNLANRYSRVESLSKLAANRAKASVLGALDSPMVATGILGLELYNTYSFLNNIQNNFKNNTGFRFAVDFMAIVANLTSAAEGATAKLIINQHLYEKYITKKLWDAPKLLQALGIKTVTRRLLIVGPAVVFDIVRSSMDLVKDLFYYRDPGAAAGSAVLLVASMAGIPALAAMLSEGAVFFAATGWLLVILGLVILGLLIKYLFSYNELEKWIVNGPFADKSKFNLQEESYAFYQLQQVLSGLSATFIKINKKGDKENIITEAEWKIMTKGADMPKLLLCLSINAMPGFLDKNTLTINSQIVANTDNGIHIKPIHYFQQLTPTGINIYFNPMADGSMLYNKAKEAGYRMGSWIDDMHIDYCLTLQATTQLNEKTYAYPGAGDIYNPISYDIKIHNIPPTNGYRTGTYVFASGENDKPFWLRKSSDKIAVFHDKVEW